MLDGDDSPVYPLDGSRVRDVVILVLQAVEEGGNLVVFGIRQEVSSRIDCELSNQTNSSRGGPN